MEDQAGFQVNDEPVEVLNDSFCWLAFHWYMFYLSLTLDLYVILFNFQSMF